MRSAVQALTALREAQNHRNATLAGQQENRRGPLGVRKPLSISHYQTRIREKSNGNGKWRGISERFPENSVTHRRRWFGWDGPGHSADSAAKVTMLRANEESTGTPRNIHECRGRKTYPEVVMRGAFVVQLRKASQSMAGQIEGSVEEVDTGKQSQFRSENELVGFLRQRFAEMQSSSRQGGDK
jgi:hypothetical protein